MVSHTCSGSCGINLQVITGSEPLHAWIHWAHRSDCPEKHRQHKGTNAASTGVWSELSVPRTNRSQRFVAGSPPACPRLQMTLWVPAAPETMFQQQFWTSSPALLCARLPVLGDEPGPYFTSFFKTTLNFFWGGIVIIEIFTLRNILIYLIAVVFNWSGCFIFMSYIFMVVFSLVVACLLKFANLNQFIFCMFSLWYKHIYSTHLNKQRLNWPSYTDVGEEKWYLIANHISVTGQSLNVI